MASGISTVVLAGNLTRDAELNPSGQVLSFSVAVNRRAKDGDEWVDVVSFLDCKVLGARAEPLSSLLTKGTKVTVQGDLVQERWETSDGDKRSAVRILAREVVLGGSRGGSASSEPKSDDDPGW